jgi:hypothetical protein
LWGVRDGQPDAFSVSKPAPRTAQSPRCAALAAFRWNGDTIAIAHLTGKDHLRQRVRHMTLDHPLQGPCPIGGVPALGRKPIARRGIEGQHNLALLQKLLQPAEPDLDNPSHFALLQTMEQNDLVDPVEEFGTEMRAPSSRTAEVSSPSGWLTRNSACHFVPPEPSSAASFVCQTARADEYSRDIKKIGRASW